MHLTISTSVEQDYRTVMHGFNQDLFLKLNPPFPPVKLLRFDGCHKDDIVSLELNFFLFKQRWTSLILEDGLDDREFYFVDAGTELPFFLKSWEHKHRILQDKQETRIIDDIHFRSPMVILDFLLWPVLWLQFLYRKPIYRRVFRKK